ncbi:MAG TPA: hypothetical protein DDW71_00160 [Lactobacillus sp.]|nr:hypothetical protein [Lactobacillus sp.]
MKKNWFKKLFGGIFLIVVTLVSVSAIGESRGEASTYQDGSYTIQVATHKTGTTTPSVSQRFFAPSAVAVVTNDTASVTMTIQNSGDKFLKDTTVNGQSALSSDKHTLSFTVPVGQASAVASFDLAVGAGMHEQCDFSFDWGSVTKNADDQSAQINPSSPIEENSGESIDSKNDPVGESAIVAVSTVQKKDASGNVTSTTVTFNMPNQAPVSFVVANGSIPTFTPQADGSGYDIFVNGVKVGSVENGTTPTTIESKNPQGKIVGFKIVIGGTTVATVPDGAQGSSSNSSNSSNPSTPLADVSKLSYTVLQSDGSSVSEANKYYTHTASIEKLSNGSYKVTMHVQYGKNSGMSAKGFVPLTVDGKKVSDVTYESTDKDYTASFSFTVPNLDALTKAPVKGTIHVSVPTMDISSDFDIYYLFTGATASDGTGTTNANSSVAAETPSNSSQTPVKAVTATSKKASSKLPQTSEIPNATIAVVGFLSLIMIVTTTIYRRKRV